MPEPKPTPPPQTSPPARVYTPDFLTELFRNPLDAGYADAAARKAASGAPAPLKRTGFLLRTIALVVIGLLLVVAYQQTVAAKPESTKLRQNLADDVSARQKEAAALQNKADDLRAQVTKLRDSVLVSSDAAALRNLETTVGVAAVSGNGAAVMLADGPLPTDPVTGKTDTNPEDFFGRVLDTDLQVVANELWRDGAEAIAINGQRLTATSAIRIAGSAILVDLVPLSQPYQIVAIGPDDLAARFSASSTGAEYQRLHDTYGMRFSVASRTHLTAPAATDSDLRYATPINGTESSPPPGGASSKAPSSSTSGGP